MKPIHSMVKRGKTAIIASHDPRVEGFADRILRMEDSRSRGEVELG
jgi:ABC-type lipoprotein export system ATPase subunit